MNPQAMRTEQARKARTDMTPPPGNITDLSHLKPTKEDVEFQREMRNKIIDNIGELKKKKITAGSETLDKILLDFYKMLYDERNPVQ
jgi:hypothetical protein